MKIHIVARDGNISKEQREYATAKGERLGRYFDGAKKMEIILAKDRVEFTAELIVSIDSAEPVTVHARHETVNGAIDLAVDQAKRGLLKHKEKIRKHHGRGKGGMGGPGEVASAPPKDDLESYDQVIDDTEFR